MSQPTLITVDDATSLVVWADAVGPKRLYSLRVNQTAANAIAAYAQVHAIGSVGGEPAADSVPLISFPITYGEELYKGFGEDGREILVQSGATRRQGCVIKISSTRNTFTAYATAIFDIEAEYSAEVTNLAPPTGANKLVVSEGGPFTTLAAAKAAAVSGDTIEVFPGTYEENDLLKDGVNWFLHAGVLISYTITTDIMSAKGIFDDYAGAVSCVIDGAGDLFYNTGEYNGDPGTGLAGRANVLGCIVIANANSNINIRLNKLTFQSLSGSTAVFVRDCEETHIHLNVLANNLTASGLQKVLPIDESFWVDFEAEEWTFNSLDTGVYWEIGEFYIHIGHCERFASYSLYAAEPVGANTANMYYTGDLLEGKIYQAAHSLTYVSWINIAYQNAMNSDIACTFYGGKIYYTSNKTGSTNNSVGTMRLFDCGGGPNAQLEVWLNVQKASGYGTLLRTSGTTYTAKIYANISHFEDLGGIVDCVEVNALSELRLGPAYMKILNGSGVNFLGGVADIKGLTIDTSNTNSVNNRPVKAAAAGLKLSNCQLIAPALADSIYAAAARNVTCMSVFANKAKHANVTVIVGTLTVDAALV